LTLKEDHKGKNVQEERTRKTGREGKGRKGKGSGAKGNEGK
jgi:hypothetical protein